MKFSHIADVHIGSWRDPKMKELSAEAFIAAIDESIHEKVDFILIAGDLFNTAMPGIDGIKTAVKKLKEAKDAGIPVYYIAGSHDYSPSGKTMLDVIEEAGIGTNVTRGRVTDDGKLHLEFTTDTKTNTKITGIIGRRGQLERKYYEALEKEALEKEKGFKIFMFHTSIDEMKPEEMKNMESHPASFLPKGFDYYAGGHVHIVKIKNIEEHGYKNLVYPGPTFPANFSELEKLGTGGFYIYENGNIKRKEIKLKDIIKHNIILDGKTPEESKKIIEEKLEKENPKDKIILLRIEGKLKSGKSSDIDFNTIINSLYEKGTYYVMKNSSKLTSAEFEEIKTKHGSAEEVEDKIIEEHTGQIKNNFKDEKQIMKTLIKTFSDEKHEGEKQADYESRILKEADGTLK